MCVEVKFKYSQRERLECLGVAIYGPCFVIEVGSRFEKVSRGNDWRM